MTAAGSETVQGPVTLRDIASETGLSVSAVSMALKDHSRIGVETKTRVRKVAKQLGYVPNSAGRALRERRSGALALIVPNTSQHVFGHAYFMHVLTGVTDAANDVDALVSISTNRDASHDMVAYERVMRSGSADGAIVTSAAVDDKNIARLVNSGIPVVLLGRYPHFDSALSVGVDDEAAGFSATEHLIVTHGRRRLLHISGPLNHQSAIDRRDGFVRAVNTHSIEHLVVEGDFSETSGRSAADEASVTLQGFDGIFAANDEMAFGAMKHLTSLQQLIPSQVSIVGFDDFGLSRVTTPSITTMHVPAESMARQATERLLDLIAGLTRSEMEPHLVLPVELVARQSCGCEPS